MKVCLDENIELYSQVDEFWKKNSVFEEKIKITRNMQTITK